MTRDEDWQRDAELLARWREGDTEAGAELYDRHSATVYRMFRTKVPDQAEELMQQTFLALVEGRDKIREGTSVRAFVLSIARFKLIDQLRSLTKGRAFDAELESVAAVAPGPSTVLAKKREQRLLLEGLRRIPIEHQIALELHYWEGLKANEIAAVFGISHSAMRSRLSKARQLLEQAIVAFAASPEERDSTLGGLEAWAAQVRDLI
ncbi:RNA polymerase sigma factor [Enhygromyxa salina]|uniref:RNA polymerase sigma factor n=1 Tax=Enhygromyxa salina TaxID=215803 RepID=UPI001FD61014|nr:sigma-70 family RNA polymerase sigma factor [Enhygromyxa salina]